MVASKGLSPNPDPSGEHPDGDPHMWMNPLNAVTYVQNIRDGLTREFRRFGFKFITLDLDGFRSGSLNELVPLELKTRFEVSR